MISATFPIGIDSELPRRDLLAIFPYLNRKEFEAKPRWEQLRQVDGILQRLATASRMQ
jgi:hypothetical protein